MSFARPEILWALFALLIPIIVHLFNFRRFRKVTFSNVSFLKEVQQETKSRSKIKHFLILFARLIALACLILAFAQPFIPLDENNKAQGDRAISIYIDNSFSMEGESEEGQLLEVAKNKARELLLAYGPTDRFQIITNDFEGRHQRLVSKEEAKELIDEIQVSAQVRKLEDVISRQNDLLKSNELEGERLSFLLSDLQKNTHELSADFKADSLINVRFVPQLSAIDVNVYIDSVWFDTPVRVLNQPEVLHLRVKHNSDEVLENIPLQLNINGARKAIGNFKLVPGIATDTSLTFTQTTAGNQFASLSIEDYPVTFDDEFFFSYNVASQISILDIKGNSAGSNVEKVFANDPFYAYSSMSEGQVNYGELGTYQLLILNQLDALSSGLVNELENYTRNGGTCLFIPSENGDVSTYNELTLALANTQIAKSSGSFKVDEINLDHFIYSGVFESLNGNIDLPKGDGAYVINRSSRNDEEQLLSLQSGTSFLAAYPLGNGRFYLLATSLSSSQSNFAQHALFVPSLLRIAEFSQRKTPLYYPVSDEVVIELSNKGLQNDEVFEIRSKDNEFTFIPESRQLGGKTQLFVHSQIQDAGQYELGQGEVLKEALSFNYSRLESATQAYSISEWQGVLNEKNWSNAAVFEGDIDRIAALVANIDEGRTLWWMFLVLALAFLFLEVIFIKLF